MSYIIKKCKIIHLHELEVESEGFQYQFRRAQGQVHLEF